MHSSISSADPGVVSIYRYGSYVVAGQDVGFCVGLSEGLIGFVIHTDAGAISAEPDVIIAYCNCSDKVIHQPVAGGVDVP